MASSFALTSRKSIVGKCRTFDNLSKRERSTILLLVKDSTGSCCGSPTSVTVVGLYLNGIRHSASVAWQASSMMTVSRCIYIEMLLQHIREMIRLMDVRHNEVRI